MPNFLFDVPGSVGTEPDPDLHRLALILAETVLHEFLEMEALRDLCEDG
jgi:hypothetical protein